MANITTTNTFRQRIARHFFDNSALPAITQMAFGSGGHNPDGTPKTEDPAQTELQNEVYRKALTGKYQDDDYSLTCVGRLEEGELDGVPLSEIGLIDADGNLCAFKNTSLKILDSDEYWEPKIVVRF